MFGLKISRIIFSFRKKNYHLFKCVRQIFFFVWCNVLYCSRSRSQVVQFLKCDWVGTSVYFIVREGKNRYKFLKGSKNNEERKKKMETRLKEKSRDGCTFNLYLSYSKAPDNERPIDCTFIHCDFFLNEIVS